MLVNKRTYYKALLLLIVFSLNTVISFACSFSSFFHGFHHHNNPTTPEHKHSGNHHDSQGEKNKHDHGTQPEHKHESGSPDNSKDDCCSSAVIQIEKLEKAVSRTIEAPHAIFVASQFAVYKELSSLPALKNTFFPDHVRWQHTATIQDLRIVIQSFQI